MFLKKNFVYAMFLSQKAECFFKREARKDLRETKRELYRSALKVNFYYYFEGKPDKIQAYL